MEDDFAAQPKRVQGPALGDGAAAPSTGPVQATPKPGVPEDVRSLLGPSWIVDGEDPNLYEELLGRVGAAVQPIDIIDWILVKDVVALTWQIHRSRRQRESIMRNAQRQGMERVLSMIFPRRSRIEMITEKSEAGEIASDWFKGRKKAIKRVDQLLAQAGLSIADVSAQSLSAEAEQLDRLDSQNERHERRRDSILQQIERRRAGWSKLVKRESEDVVDAEFRELPPNPTGQQKQ